MALLAEHAALDINAANEHDGLTPFWAAACMGHEPICRLLYSAGADPSATPHRSTHAAHVGAPAFWVACEQGRTAVVRLLASLGLHATEDLNHPYAPNALRLKLGKPTTHSRKACLVTVAGAARQKTRRSATTTARSSPTSSCCAR